MDISQLVEQRRNGCSWPHLARLSGMPMTTFRRRVLKAMSGHEPVPTGSKQVGDPDGYGLYGILDRGQDSVACHECPERFASLGAHTILAHGETAAQYRQAHGLPRTMPLTSISLSAQRSQESSARVGSSQWKKFEKARDPLAASLSRDPASFTSPSSQADRSALMREVNHNRSGQGHVKTCPVCGAEYRGRNRTCSSECAISAQRQGAREQSAHRRRLATEEIESLRTTGGDPLIVRALLREGCTATEISSVLGISKSTFSRRFSHSRNNSQISHIIP